MIEAEARQRMAAGGSRGGQALGENAQPLPPRSLAREGWLLVAGRSSG